MVRCYAVFNVEQADGPLMTTALDRVRAAQKTSDTLWETTYALRKMLPMYE